MHNTMQEGYYSGGGRPKKMSKKEIKEMMTNMQKTDKINRISNEYHDKEIKEAEDILNQIYDEK